MSVSPEDNSSGTAGFDTGSDRLAGHTLQSKSMRDKVTRGELRAGHISGWGWDKLCAVAHSLDHDVVVTPRPRTPASV